MDHVATHVGLYSMSGLGHAGTETVRRSLKITDEKRRPVGFFSLQTNQSPPTRMRWSSQAVDVLHADMQSSSHHTHTQRRSKAKFFTEPARNNCRQAKKRESRRAAKKKPAEHNRNAGHQSHKLAYAQVRPRSPSLSSHHTTGFLGPRCATPAIDELHAGLFFLGGCPRAAALQWASFGHCARE